MQAQRKEEAGERVRERERERTTEGQSDVVGAGPDPPLGRGHKPRSAGTSTGWKALPEETLPCRHLEFSSVSPTFDLQNCKIANVCCLKPLILWRSTKN